MPSVLLLAILGMLLMDSRGEVSKCESKIYCRGDLLDKIQESRLFADSKRFVDMPTKFPSYTVLTNFYHLGPNPTLDELENFVAANFYRAGHELRIVRPKDWKLNISLLSQLKHNQPLFKFTKLLHSKWKSLIRHADHDRKLCPECESSHLRLPYPFVVPGGRFREFYYWDTYWILEGLFVSEMCSTANFVIANLLQLVEKYQKVPNGSRIYYLNRSQPPMLPKMIKRFLQECAPRLSSHNTTQFLSRTIPLLEQEYQFWMDNRSVSVRKDAQSFILNHYEANTDEPRPESYREDKILGNQIKDSLARKELYVNIASAAESGWDFSARWIENYTQFENAPFPLEYLKASKVLPVDLNSIMFQNEMILSEFYTTLKEQSKATKFRQAAIDRSKAIKAILFRKDKLYWLDYLYKENRHLDRPFYISDLSPLWYGAYHQELTTKDIDNILERHENFLFGYDGGIPISEVSSGQQWDFPNVWAPVQFQMVTLMESLGHQEKALNISQRWINSVYCGLELFDQIFEKYHSEIVGNPGGGGEYIVQEGFGWTNGVTLWMIKKFGSKLTIPTQCARNNKLAPLHSHSALQTKVDIKVEMNDRVEMIWLSMEKYIMLVWTCTIMVTFAWGFLLIKFKPVIEKSIMVE